MSNVSGQHTATKTMSYSIEIDPLMCLRDIRIVCYDISALWFEKAR